MTMAAHRRRARVAGSLPLLLALSAVVLPGCVGGASAAGEGSPSSEPSPSPSILESEPLSGVGQTEPTNVPFPIPDGAQSLSLTFECDGGPDDQFSVELGDSMVSEQGIMHGQCGDQQEFSWPITTSTESILLVWAPEGVSWVATPTFSTEPFVSDAALTADCGAFAEAYSALMNADQGYTLYDAFDEAEWNDRVDGAVADLADLAATGSPTIVDAVERVRANASSPDRVVGTVLTDGTLAAIGEVSDACNRNHSPLILMGEFGG